MTTAALIAPVGVGPVPATDWRAALLQRMGLPVNPTNLAALSFWHQSEGTDSATYNWLAITDPYNKYPHAGVVAPNGGNPVYAFPSFDIGVQALADFLSAKSYSGVRDAFAGSDQSTHGLADIWQAVNSSGWCSGCQNGEYPTVLFRAKGGGVPDPGPTAGEPGNTTPAGGPVSNPPDRSAPDCLIGPFTMPGPIPNIPCLLTKSQGWAIVGAGALVGGGLVMLVALGIIAGVGLPGLPTLPERRDREGEYLQRQHDRDAEQALSEKNAAAAKASRRSEDTGYRPGKGLKGYPRGRSTIITREDEEPF